MESTKPTILNFKISNLSFVVQQKKREQIMLKLEKKFDCSVDEAKHKDKLNISVDVAVKSAPEGAFEFSAQCSAIVAPITQDISDDELKDQIERIFIPLVDQMLVEKIKKITTEMGQTPLDLTTKELDGSNT